MILFGMLVVSFDTPPYFCSQYGFTSANLISFSKLLSISLFIIFLVQIALIIRIGFIQFVQGTELQAMAYSQQTLNRSINPKRGRILDRTGKEIGRAHV